MDQDPYPRRLIVQGDVWLNVFFRGLAGSTISARAYTARKNGKRWGCILCGLLEKFWTDHCRKAVLKDIARAQAAIEDLQRGL